MPSHSAAERAALADALTAAGPRHPTLCDGWTTTELAAHLVARERRVDSAIGQVIRPLSGWTDRVQGQYARWDYERLVEAFRRGPPVFSYMALPGVDARLNLIEHFVHCEDVRRARPGWQARELPARRQAALWSQLTTIGRALWRRSPVSVTIATPEGARASVIERTGPGVTMVGEPGELVLYAYGRKDHATIQLEGPDDAVDAFRRLSVRV
jgi:uncharacterized protein (TIGR03085 family)